MVWRRGTEERARKVSSYTKCSYMWQLHVGVRERNKNVKPKSMAKLISCLIFLRPLIPAHAYFSLFVVTIFHMVLSVRLNPNVNFRIVTQDAIWEWKFSVKCAEKIIVITIIKDERYAKDKYVNQRKRRSGNYCRQWILSMNRVTAKPNAEVTYLIISNGVPVSGSG